MALVELTVTQLGTDVGEIKSSNRKIIGWLMGACFTLTTSAILLAMNLSK